MLYGIPVYTNGPMASNRKTYVRGPKPWGSLGTALGKTSSFFVARPRTPPLCPGAMALPIPQQGLPHIWVQHVPNMFPTCSQHVPNMFQLDNWIVFELSGHPAK